MRPAILVFVALLPASAAAQLTVQDREDRAACLERAKALGRERDVVFYAKCRDRLEHQRRVAEERKAREAAAEFERKEAERDAARRAANREAARRDAAEAEERRTRYEQQLAEERRADEAADRKKRRRCGKDYMRLDLGMKIERVSDCAAPARRVGASETVNGRIYVYRVSRTLVTTDADGRIIQIVGQ